MPDRTDQATPSPVRIVEDSVLAVDASTVILLRGGADALEVLMLERHIESDFVGGAYVFPGGKVGAEDSALPADRWTGLDLAAAAARFRCQERLALGLHVAAVRETFEEAGVLLALRDGRPVGAAEIEQPSYVVARRRLAARGEHWDWLEWLAEERLVLDLGRLAWWAWWVTPEGVHRRFDTRFFVARTPDDQVAMHDRVEITDSRWISPAQALRDGRAGQVKLILPTRMNLQALADRGNAAAVWATAAEGRSDTRRIQPTIVKTPAGTRVQHPHLGELQEI